MNGPLVDPVLLAEGAGDWIVLDASVEAVETAPPRRYRAAAAEYARDGHIPGARFADLVDAFSDPAGAFPFTRPGPRQFERSARARGVSDASRIVVYDRANGIWAARLWWLFRAYGHEAAFVLDGGLRAWTGAGLPLEHGTPPPPPPGTFAARKRPGHFVDTP